MDVESLRVLLKKLYLLDVFKFEDDLMKLSCFDNETRQNLVVLLNACRNLAYVPHEVLPRKSSYFASAAAAITDLLDRINNPSSFSEQQLLQSFQKCTAELRLLNPESRRFSSEKSEENRVKEALKEYIKHAEMIRRNQAAFKDSPLHLLEQMIKDKQATCEKLFPDLVQANYLSASTAFIALSAPSYVGKTQSAFLDGDVKPLYFSFVNRVENPQSIYMNFIEISNKLEILAAEDVKVVNDYVCAHGIDATNDERISVSFLSLHSSIRFWSLGFLKALAKHMKAKAEQNKTTLWMELLAGDLEFDYEQASIDECKKSDCFKGLYLFLDEFPVMGSPNLLRSIACALGLTCVVSKTDAKIVNGSGHVRTDSSCIWSIVFTELNCADLKLLDEFFDLTGSVNKILSHCPEDEREAVSEFFAALQNSMKIPGTAIIVAQALKRFIDENIFGQFCLGALAECVARALVQVFRCQKPGMVEGNHGRLAKLALSIPQSFERITLMNEIPFLNDLARDRVKLCNQAKYMWDHLYYLTNPQDINSSVFLTFGPDYSTSSEQEAVKPLRVYCDDKLMSWTRELAHFKREDFGTLMGCLSVPLGDSVGRFLIKRVLIKDDWEFVSAAIIVTESSRHGHDDRRCFTFAGQSGQDFVKNIVRNMILKFTIFGEYAQMLASDTVSITFDNSKLFDLGLYFQSCHVPFLYGWNRGNEVFDHLSAFNRHSFYVSKLSRSANKDEIDASMPFKYVLSADDEQLIDSHIAIECKNFFGTADCTELCSILTKARKGTFHLSFVFAQKFSKTSQPINPKKPEVSHLTRLCKKEKINLYRVIKTDSMAFKIVPFEAKTKIVKNPNLICLLFETDRINVTQ